MHETCGELNGSGLTLRLLDRCYYTNSWPEQVLPSYVTLDRLESIRTAVPNFIAVLWICTVQITKFFWWTSVRSTFHLHFAAIICFTILCAVGSVLIVPILGQNFFWNVLPDLSVIRVDLRRRISRMVWIHVRIVKVLVRVSRILLVWSNWWGKGNGKP